MTEIIFHTRVAEPVSYACRLLRKATRQGARVAVTGSDAALTRLDHELWAFEPTAFVPHVRVAGAEAIPARLAITPVWLCDDPSVLDLHEVLVNLGAESVRGFESYARLIEIVSRDDAELAAARRRWKHYGDRGYRVAHHESAA